MYRCVESIFLLLLYRFLRAASRPRWSTDPCNCTPDTRTSRCSRSPYAAYRMHHTSASCTPRRPPTPLFPASIPTIGMEEGWLPFLLGRRCLHVAKVSQTNSFTFFPSRSVSVTNSSSCSPSTLLTSMPASAQRLWSSSHAYELAREHGVEIAHESLKLSRSMPRRKVEATMRRVGTSPEGTPADILRQAPMESR